MVSNFQQGEIIHIIIIIEKTNIIISAVRGNLFYFQIFYIFQEMLDILNACGLCSVILDWNKIISGQRQRSLELQITF